MKLLQNKVAELFKNGTINLMIGFKNALNKQVVPCFIENSSQAEQLIYTADCKNNLSVYLHKPEVKRFKKVGIIGNIATLRSLIQLTSENQLWDIEQTILTVNEKDEIILFKNMVEVETYVQTYFPENHTEEDKKLLEYIDSLPREERWKYWMEQFSTCIKCYACRAVCPMCYCTQCTVECNQPQWIKISSETTGNLEWHIMRAMHLAGRCIECGECGRACPVGIPIHLLTTKMNQELFKEFATRPGFSLKGEYAMNTFKPEDKEGFIK
jgi:ferredoxin